MHHDVEQLRTAAGLSRAKLGASLRHKVSRQTIHAIEIGRYVPSLQLALDIAHYFGKPVEEIFHVD